MAIVTDIGPFIVRTENSPREALDCFQRTKMDVLVLGPFAMAK
jgi:predicted NodU family carbamoyl transferase